MPYKHYDWVNSRSPPILQPHSLRKHEIIETYIENYISNLKAKNYSKNVKITIIDGFAGGGVYRHLETEKICFGSPFIFLKIVQKIEQEIRSNINGNFNIDAVYYFIDNDKNAVEFLQKQLCKRGYKKFIGKNIFLLNGIFSKIHPVISEIIKNRKSKSLFLLDQYGYKDAPIDVVSKILADFPKSEIFLTFAVGALVNYLVDTPQFYKCVGADKEKYSILSKKDISNLVILKNNAKTIDDRRAWRKIAEERIFNRIKNICGIYYYYSAPIISKKSNRSYWLLHITALKKSHIKFMEVCKCFLNHVP